MSEKFQSLFNGLNVLSTFEDIFNEAPKVSVKPTLDHIKAFLVIATASTLDEKIEMRNLSGPKSIMAPMSQTKLHRIVSAFKDAGLVNTPEGEFDSRLHTVELTDVGLNVARRLRDLFDGRPDDASLFWENKVDRLLWEAQASSGFRREIADNEERMRGVDPINWKKELVKVLQKKGIPNAEVGANYIKTVRPDNSVRGAVSHNVLFSRTGVTNLVDLVVEFDALDYDALDRILTPKIKYRDVSDDAAAELNDMLNRYSSAAIEESPALREQYLLLTAQLAREARAANKQD